jgi:hypothetical protein
LAAEARTQGRRVLTSASLTSEAWRAPAAWLRWPAGHLRRGDGDLAAWRWSTWGLGGRFDSAPGRAVVERQFARLAASVGAFVGGDNSITRPLVVGLARGDLSGVGVLTLDAQHDVRTAGPPAPPSAGHRGRPDGRAGRWASTFANSAPTVYRAEHIEVVTMERWTRWGRLVGPAPGDGERCEDLVMDVDALPPSPRLPGAPSGG